ncbi:protein of unknown function [Propionispira arboris]|uniref:DUF4194 domain-containing protein n=1 Tax=Propionispira arboris TaxID=84035 RepID=A0A1H6YU44_9FIRM|nr:DUF4194 domain-containing protein [Propionispira arboris]SEJ43846.1 protein of unknown function [Propionispira arboris]
MDKEQEFNFSRVLITLLRGVVFKERQLALWQSVLEHRHLIADYVKRLGLVLIIDEMDEYAYLRQSEQDSLPRLVPRRQLSYPVSVLLVLLRQQLGEYDSVNGDSQLLITKYDIVDKMRVFFAAMTNEIKFSQEVDRHIAKVEEMGFLRKLKTQDDTYEVERIVRSFVNAKWLQEFDERLADYIEYGAKSETKEEDGMNGLI